ncbi:hypothetical protein N0V93_005146 [Gnomoniopsis smithogilvyi]|uniref:Glucose-methanol-choline oxidoreductase N-terminal domain-containing protein n=1 Tax=Gnomoniopsis smithogilvyi TaxID=1191159 RepID=A0A9W8YTU6_9PEZI|nr:hypothetical protein N0V93_005146 [Gnomoniopsis smithogilvyi]
MKFDYIIAGGGTCGLLLANRLSADPNNSVVVIEPGQDVRNNPNVSVPENFISEPVFNTPLDWAYATEPQRGGANRTLQMHAGKALGGSSTINGMTYIRADVAEIDAWEALGNEGWNWETLLPYYKRVERYSPPTEAQVAVGASYEAQYHGQHGLLHVGNLYTLPNKSFYETVQDTWQNIGYMVNPDVNSGDTRGFDVYPMTVDRERDLRWDAARAYYYPIENRTNLKVLRGTVVKVTWGRQDEAEKNMTASGVEFVDANNKSVAIQAGKEVILSTGSLRTPGILEASGVGNPRQVFGSVASNRACLLTAVTSVLSELGIDIVVDLPGVGENLQEQPNTALVFTANLDTAGYAPYATFATADDVFGSEKLALADVTKGSLKGYAQTIAAASNAGLNTTAIEQILRIQHDLIFNQNVTIGETITLAAGGYFVTSHWLLLPFSRGSVHLRASDEANLPVIDPRYFLIDFDMTQQVGIGHQAQKFWQSSPMSDYLTGNVSGIPASDVDWVKFIEGSFAPNYHPIGTAAMMSRDLGGVVDRELKVYGTSNVRVVDASILPIQSSGHPTSTLYAIAERAADLILASS